MGVQVSDNIQILACLSFWKDKGCSICAGIFDRKQYSIQIQGCYMTFGYHTDFTVTVAKLFHHTGKGIKALFIYDIVDWLIIKMDS